MALTDKQIEAIKPSVARFALRDDGRGGVAGLELRIANGGSKTWAVRYSLDDGTRRRLTLGRYPALGLADAREKALKAMTVVANDGDPAGDKKRQRQEERTKTVRTLDDLTEALFAAGGVRPSTDEYRQWLWKKHLKPNLGDTRLADVSATVVRGLGREIGASAGPTTANRAISLLQRIFNFGVAEDYVPSNPLAKIKPLFDETSRARVLNDSELKCLWEATERTRSPARAGERDRDDLQVSRTMAIAVQLCLVTGQRGGEVAGMRRGELDLSARTWLVPAARSKSKREHLIPLSQTATDLIAEAMPFAELRLARLKTNGETERRPLASDPVFPSPRYPTKSVERMSLARAMSRLIVSAGIEDASPHDLRRTAATCMASERIGALTEVVARVLNHAPPGLGVTGIYNRHAYVAEKRRALDLWEGLLLEIVGVRERAANVTPLKSARV